MTKPPDDPFATPSDDPDERAEADWLVARDADPDAPPPSPEVGAAYARLEGLLGSLPPGRDDDAWQDAVLAKANAEPATVASATPTPRRGRWLAMAGALAAAAAVLVFVVTRPKRPGPDELAVTARHGDVARGGADEVLVGDHLVVNARPHGPTELRVYQGASIVLARCPGTACTADAAAWQLDVRVTAPGPHYVILVFGEVVAAPDATMDGFLAAARAAHARVVVHPTIDVR